MINMSRNRVKSFMISDLLSDQDNTTVSSNEKQTNETRIACLDYQHIKQCIYDVNHDVRRDEEINKIRLHANQMRAFLEMSSCVYDHYYQSDTSDSGQSHALLTTSVVTQQQQQQQQQQQHQHQHENQEKQQVKSTSDCCCSSQSVAIKNVPAIPSRDTIMWQQYLLKQRMLMQAKPRKGGQIRFTAEQTVILERRFQRQKYLSPPERKKIASQLSLTERQIKTWFQNRRAKWRRGLENDISSKKSEKCDSQYADGNLEIQEEHVEMDGEDDDNYDHDDHDGNDVRSS